MTPLGYSHGAGGSFLGGGASFAPRPAQAPPGLRGVGAVAAEVQTPAQAAPKPTPTKPTGPKPTATKPRVAAAGPGAVQQAPSPAKARQPLQQQLVCQRPQRRQWPQSSGDVSGGGSGSCGPDCQGSSSCSLIRSLARSPACSWFDVGSHAKARTPQRANRC